MSQANKVTTVIDLSSEAERAKLQATMAAWDRIVQVQMHFNDISLRIRNFLVTVILATFGAAGFSLHYNIRLATLGDFSLSPLPFLFMAGWLAIYLLYFMDRDWYHRLLKGSVEAAIPIAQKYGDLIPGLSLGEKISASSKLMLSDRPLLKVAKAMRLISTVDGAGSEESLASNGKLEFFYRCALLLMIASAIASFVGGVYIKGEWWLSAILKYCFAQAS